MSHKQHKRFVRYCRRIFPSCNRISRKVVGGLALAGLAAFVSPKPANASHGAPVFVAGPDGPFGLNDVGLWSSPSFADLDGDGDLDAFMGESGNILYFENIAHTFNAAGPLWARYE